MGTFFIVINVIITLLIKFSTQLIYNQSDTYQFNSQYAIDTNELSDEENEQLMAFSEFVLIFVTICIFFFQYHIFF